MPPQYPYIDGLEDDKQATNVKVFVRGSPYNFGEEAPRAFLSILSPGEPELFKQGSGRMELAEAIVKQPLSMRVIVNRVWRWHMGSGIVETPNNFGRVGDPPSNPELLDYLASKFVAGGMSIKAAPQANPALADLPAQHRRRRSDRREGFRQSAVLARQPAPPGGRRHLGFAADGVGQTRSQQSRWTVGRLRRQDDPPRRIRQHQPRLPK